jgi:hypothetical protein
MAALAAFSFSLTNPIDAAQCVGIGFEHNLENKT